MTYLECYDRHGLYLTWPEKIEVLILTPPSIKERLGWYSNSSNELTVLQVEDNKAKLIVREIEYSLNKECKATWGSNKLSNKKRDMWFRLNCGPKLIATFDYVIEDPIQSDFDVSAFVEDEHFNWGLFLCNIINDPGRLARIIEARS